MMKTQRSQLTERQKAKLLGGVGLVMPKEDVCITTAPSINENIVLDYTPKPLVDYKPLGFENSLEMLAYVDENIKSGSVTPHPWQVEMTGLVCAGGGVFTKLEPLRLCICAANGSGKDAYINAPWALWFIACKPRSKVVITSASYMQLVSQTENYIRYNAELFNKVFKEQGVCEKAFSLRKEHVFCELTGSEIIMFVTDDPSRAEGHHPYPDNPNGELGIVINEAKSVPDVIYEALGRCTYTHWLEVSTPGDTSGKFYRHYTRATQYPAPYRRGKWYARRITSYDCKHIPASKIEDDKEEFGVNSPVFRSKHLALFTPLDSSVVLTRDALDTCLESKVAKIDLGIGLHAGLDLAGGGDENTLYIFDDNKFIAGEVFQLIDTDITVKHLDMLFRKYNLKEDDIFADAGGLGQAILDNLRAQFGWNVNRILNQSAPARRLEYANLGTENWFKFARLVQENLVILPGEDSKLLDQLCNRRYKQSLSNKKIILEAKKEARAAGRLSPDRADAVVLAFTQISIQTFRDKDKTPGLRPQGAIYNQKQLQAFMHDKKFARINDAILNRSSIPVGNSYNAILKSIYHAND